MSERERASELGYVHGRHTMSLLTDHMVFVPKFRGRVLVGDVRDYAEKVIRELCKELELTLVEIAVGSDHVHLFFKYPPKYSLSQIANIIKGRSSKMIRRRFPKLRKWCKDSLWTPACFHASVGTGWEVVEAYISSQKDYAVAERVGALKKKMT